MIEFKQIICPVDFSESSVRALAYAAALARWYDAQLTVLHVVPTFEAMQVRGDLGEPIRVVTPMPREQVLDEMSRSLNLAALSPSATPIAESGDPQATIIDQALSNEGRSDCDGNPRPARVQAAAPRLGDRGGIARGALSGSDGATSRARWCLGGGDIQAHPLPD